MKFFNILITGLTLASTRASDYNDWYLERVGTITAKTNDPVNGILRIALKYEIPRYNRRTAIDIFNIDCVTPVPGTVVGFDHADVETASGHYFHDVNLYMTQSAISSTNVWNPTSSTTGNIEVCVRVSLMRMDNINDPSPDATVYNFDEQKLFVAINLAQGFEVSQIDVDRADATSNNENAQTDYGLTICQCNQNSDCTPTLKVFQGEAPIICIKTTDGTGIEVSSIQQLTYAQEGVPLYTAISEGISLPYLTKVVNQGTSASIQAQLPIDFFAPANVDKPLVGSGTVVLRFGSALIPNRNLRFVIADSVDHMHGSSSSSRMMQAQTNETETGFSVSMALAPLESEDAPTADSKTGVIIGVIVGGIAGVAVIIVALVLAARRRGKKEDDYNEGVYKVEDDKDEAYTEDDDKDDGDKEEVYKEEAFKEVDDKEEYAMTGSEVYA